SWLGCGRALRTPRRDPHWLAPGGDQTTLPCHAPRARRGGSHSCAAHAALLDQFATDLLERIQDIMCETTRSQMLRALDAAPPNVTELTRVLACSKWTASRHQRI